MLRQTRGSGARVAEADLVGVHRVFGHLPPEVLVGTEGRDVVVELLEPLVLAREVGVEFLRGLVAAFMTSAGTASAPRPANTSFLSAAGLAES